MHVKTQGDRQKIRAHNDNLRRRLVGGQVVLTNSVSDLPPPKRMEVIAAVMNFCVFDQENDPHDEHDFGMVDVQGAKYFWKIDYYDQSMEAGSPDPADPEVTKRVLTIMRADEY